MQRMIPKVVHLCLSDYDLAIDRTSKWGNPYKLDHQITKEDAIVLGDLSLEGKQVSRIQCIDLYKNYLNNNIELLACLPELEGKILGCWCKDKNGKGKRCHGDAIVEVFIEEVVNKKLFEY